MGAPSEYACFDVSCKYDNCLKKRIDDTPRGKVRYKCDNCNKITTLGEPDKPKLKLETNNKKSKLSLKFK